MASASIDFPAAAKRLIRVDSRSARGSGALVDVLTPLFHDVGLDVTLQTEEREGVWQQNVIASRGLLAADSLVLASHLDTVPPGDHALWTSTNGDPFSLTERSGYWYGLGVADVKLDLLCKLAAVDRLRDVRLRKGVCVVGTYGEETARFGAKLLVRRLDPLPQAILVGEPTGLQPLGGHKSYAEFRVACRDDEPQRAPDLPRWRLTFEGVSAHSSQPDRGSSAISACLDAIERLEEGGAAVLAVRGGDVPNKVASRCESLVAAEWRPSVPGAGVESADVAAGAESVEVVGGGAGADVWSPALTEVLFDLYRATSELTQRARSMTSAEYDPPFSSVNNGIVSMAHGELIFVVDARGAPGTMLEEALALYGRRLDQIAAERPGLSGEVDHSLRARPYRPEPTSRLLSVVHKVLEKHSIASELGFMSATTEAPVYQAAGMDVVVLGPGEAVGNIHRPNEKVAIADLDKAVEIYVDIVRAWCL